MLPKKNRLKKDKDFKNIYLKGRVFQNNFFIIRILENYQDINRFGFVVSGNVSKKAVERNKLKRRLREIVRKNLNYFRKGYDFVIIAKKDSCNKSYKILKENLLSLLKLFLNSKSD